jgi:hypothetical protein
MSNLIVILIFIGIIYLGYKKFTKPKYRILLTDPVTGYRKYLMSVDGINDTFKYSSDSKSALIFNNGARAEQFITAINENASPEVEMKTIFGWKTINQG